MNDPSDSDQKQEVVDFLTQSKATFDNVIIDIDKESPLAGELGVPEYPPLYQLYDRTGKKRFTFSPIPASLPGSESIDKLARSRSACSAM